MRVRVSCSRPVYYTRTRATLPVRSYAASALIGPHAVLGKRSLRELVHLVYQSACPRCLSRLSLMPLPSGHPRLLPVPDTHERPRVRVDPRALRQPLLSSTLPTSTSSSQVSGDELTSLSRRWTTEDRRSSRMDGGEDVLAPCSHPRPSPRSRSTPATTTRMTEGRAEVQQATHQRCLSCFAACPRPPRLSIRCLPPSVSCTSLSISAHCERNGDELQRSSRWQRMEAESRAAAFPCPPRLYLRLSAVLYPAVRPHPHRWPSARGV